MNRKDQDIIEIESSDEDEALFTEPLTKDNFMISYSLLLEHILSYLDAPSLRSYLGVINTHLLLKVYATKNCLRSTDDGKWFVAIFHLQWHFHVSATYVFVGSNWKTVEQKTNTPKFSSLNRLIVPIKGWLWSKHHLSPMMIVRYKRMVKMSSWIWRRWIQLHWSENILTFFINDDSQILVKLWKN